MRYFIYFGLLSVLIFISCSQNKINVDDGTILSGRMQSPKADKIYFYSYADSIDYFLNKQTITDSAIIGVDGKYEFSLKINEPKVFSLYCGAQQLVANLFIRPNDKLEINFYGNKNAIEIIPFREEAKLNTFLVSLIDTFYIETTRKNEYYIASNYMDMHNYVRYTDKRKHEMLELFNSFFKEDSVNNGYRNYVVYTIEYESACDRLMYLWKKRMKGEAVTPDSLFLSFASEQFIENDAAFITPSYIRFLNLYIKDVYERMVERGELPRIKGEVLIPAAEKYLIAQNVLSGKFRSVVMYNLFTNDASDLADSTNSTKVVRKDFSKLEEEFKIKYKLN